MVKRILVIGANGQIGCELVEALSKEYGAQNVFAADLAASSRCGAAHYLQLDVLDADRLAGVVAQHGITDVCQLAALLSVSAEQTPLKAWTLNMDGLLHVLELARLRNAAGTPLQVFWPSSIASFGPHSPVVNAPQMTAMDPTTIYGICKLAGERLCEYYYTKYGVDVRSIRYPGLVSYTAPPGGGTTDYAIAIFHAALRGAVFHCYLSPDTVLPMMYMPDAVRATIALMKAPAEKISIRSAYNVAGVSFSPAQLAAEIQRHHPGFIIEYHPDERQAIADTWPDSVEDADARADWQWRAHHGLPEIVADMLKNIVPAGS